MWKYVGNMWIWELEERSEVRVVVYTFLPMKVLGLEKIPSSPHMGSDPLYRLWVLEKFRAPPPHIGSGT